MWKGRRASDSHGGGASASAKGADNLEAREKSFSTTESESLRHMLFVVLCCELENLARCSRHEP